VSPISDLWLTRERWAVRVTYVSGHEAFVRDGAGAHGAIAMWPSKARAEQHADVLRAGVDRGVIVAVVPHPGHRG
jgi:hypothetical protein